MAIPVSVYLFEFMVIDLFLSLAFLAWPIRSPNYFYAVDQKELDKDYRDKGVALVAISPTTPSPSASTSWATRSSATRSRR